MKSYLISRLTLGFALRLSALVLLLAGAAAPAHAVPLRVVEVGAPAIPCKFDSDCGPDNNALERSGWDINALFD